MMKQYTMNFCQKLYKNGWNQASKSDKDLEVFFCPFLEERNFRNEKSMVQYPRSYQRDKRIIEKEQNTNHTQVSQTCISKQI